jgi:predicted nucleic-acid-binding protein
METRKEQAEKLFKVFYESITGIDFVYRNIDNTKEVSNEDRLEIINRLTAKICACECCEEIINAVKEYDKYRRDKTDSIKNYYQDVIQEINNLWNQ